MLTKQPRITTIPGTNPIRGQVSYTVCAPATPGGGGGGDDGGEQVCAIICRPREDIGMGSPTIVCGVECYWQS